MNSRAAAVLLCVAGVLASTPVCSQFDFKLSSTEGKFQYGYYAQLGSKGFFGAYNLDLSTTGNFGSTNGWIGNNAAPPTDIGEIVSGTSVMGSKLSVEANPRLIMDWVSAEAKYTVTAYELGSVQGTYNPVSPTFLSTWFINADTPIARFGWGKKDAKTFAQGFGLQFSGARTEDYFFIERDFDVPNIVGTLVNIGLLPLRALNWFNPAGWSTILYPEKRRVEEREALDAVFQETNKDIQKTFNIKPDRPGIWNSCFPITREADYAPGRLHIGFGAYPRNTIFVPATGATASDAPIPVWNQQDVNASFCQDLLFYANYFSTELALGSGILYRNSHQGPELQPVLAVKLDTPTKDTYLTEGWLYLAYSNGTLFVNSELDWYNRIVRFQRSFSGSFRNPDTPQDPAAPPLPGIIADGSGRSRFAPQFIESWRYMFEIGGYSGPASLRFFYSFMPGRDRRHGILIDRQPFVDFSRQQALGPFSPYSILLSSLYSGGVNAAKHVSDASVYAVKLDYAIAANMILEVAFLKAFRNSHGFGWGSIRPTVTIPDSFVPNVRVSYLDPGTFSAPTPAIPDNDLGWEMVAGITWQLLDGFGVETRFAYWQPGAWFKYACIDRGVPGWNAPSSTNNWGINPNRDIDPVLGLEIRLGATY